MGIEFAGIQDGFATASSPLTRDLLKEDSRPIEPSLAISGNFHPEPRKIPFAHYVDPDFAKLEMEHVWKKCWQVVGREEDIPEIGDRKPYDVGPLSYIILRSGPNEFRALQNACLHRGTQLCHGLSAGSSIKCLFHAWEWNLDGSLKNIPSRWDFPHVKNEEYELPQARIDRWGGYLFINPDKDCGPLSDALGVLPAHFTGLAARERYTAVGFRKKLRGNWKQAMEAFLEAYHVAATHTEFMPYNADTASSYDIWDDGKSQISRAITPSAMPSGHLGDEASRVVAAQEALKAFAISMPGIVLPEITSAENGRSEVAEWRRTVFGPAVGIDLSNASDSYMLDANQYFMFPNCFPWFGEGLPLSYQLTPYGTEPDECVMEVRLTLPVPDHGERPPAAELIEVDFDTPVSSIPALGLMATVFDQDFWNIPLVQLGLRGTLNPDISLTLGRYQECRITAFHDMLERRIAAGTAKTE